MATKFEVIRDGKVLGIISDDVFIDNDKFIHPINNRVFTVLSAGTVLSPGIVEPIPSPTFKLDATKKILTRNDGVIFDLIEVD